MKASVSWKLFRFRIFRWTTGILSTVIISSCAVNKIQDSRTERYLAHIKQGHFRKQTLRCVHPGSAHFARKNKAIRCIPLNNRHSDKWAINRPEKKENGYNKRSGEREVFSGTWISLPDKRPSDGNYYDGLPQHLMQANNIILPELSGIPVPGGSFQIMNKTDFPGLAEYHQVHIPQSASQPRHALHCSLRSMKQEIRQDKINKKPGGNTENLIHHPATSDQSQAQSFPGKVNLVYVAALLVGLLSFFGLKYAPNLTATISSWAYMNPWKTRYIITGMHLTLGSSAFILGEKLADGGTYLPDLSKYLLMAVFFTSALLYPVRKSQSIVFRYSYLRQKAHDLATILSACMLMVYVGNHPSNQTFSLTGRTNSEGHNQYNIAPVNKSQSLYHPAFYQENVKPQDDSAVPQKKELTKAEKIAFTILSVLGFLLLAFGLVLLSCSIYCNGLEALAFVVGIGLGALLITSLVLVLRAIHRPKHKKKVEPATQMV